MALGGRWWLCLLRDYKGLKLGAVEAPHQVRRVHRGYGKSLIVNSKSPRREQAIAFVLFMAARDYNELINHQADALGPVDSSATPTPTCTTRSSRRRTTTRCWRTALEHARPGEVSPFVNGKRWSASIAQQLDLVKNNAKTPGRGHARDWRARSTRKSKERSPRIPTCAQATTALRGKVANEAPAAEARAGARLPDAQPRRLPRLHRRRRCCSRSSSRSPTGTSSTPCPSAGSACGTSPSSSATSSSGSTSSTPST